MTTPPSGSRRWLTTPRSAGISLALFAVTFALARLGEPTFVVVLGGIAGLAFFGATVLVAGGRTVLGVSRLGQIARGRSDLELVPTLVTTLGNLSVVGFGIWLPYTFIEGFYRWR